MQTDKGGGLDTTQGGQALWESAAAIQEALRDVLAFLDHTAYDVMAEALIRCEGAIVFVGVGKAGLVAKKSAATLASYGIRSAFLHPVEACHGDMGMLDRSDMVVLVSNSGETEELIHLHHLLQQKKQKCFALVGRPESTLSKALGNDAVVYGNVAEYCYLHLAPTTSTLVMMWLLDTLAGTVAKGRGVKAQAFFSAHPGGCLGTLLKTESAV